MNHMANEFYFDGHAQSQAPWRFHEEDGLREYLLRVRKVWGPRVFVEEKTSKKLRKRKEILGVKEKSDNIFFVFYFLNLSVFFKNSNCFF